ncbi:MAG: hypothetical protein QFB86_01470 [Patescibacteria group bacterium]|nr:hypothetical protein [Patescibacteria group bacterium]
MKQLNQGGFSHIVGVLVVIVFAISGIGYLVSSSADTPTASAAVVQLGKINVKTRSTNGAVYNENGEGWQGTKPSKDVLIVESLDGNCNGVSIRGKVTLGVTRTLRCKPGTYKVSLNASTEVKLAGGGRVYKQSSTVNVHDKSRATVYLGSKY